MSEERKDLVITDDLKPILEVLKENTWQTTQKRL